LLDEIGRQFVETTNIITVLIVSKIIVALLYDVLNSESYQQFGLVGRRRIESKEAEHSQSAKRIMSSSRML